MNLQLMDTSSSGGRFLTTSLGDYPKKANKKFPFKTDTNNTSSYSSKIYYRDRLNSHRSQLFNDFYKKIIELKKLSKGWDSYNAAPPNYSALTKSIKVLNLLFELELIPTQISPSVEGGVSFLFAKKIKYADIECDNDGDIFAGMSDRTGEPILWQINGKDYENNLNKSISQIRLFLEN